VPARNQRGTRRDALGGRARLGLDGFVSHHPLQQSLFTRLPRSENSPFEQDLERDGGNDHRQEPAQLAVAHGEAEPTDRNTEAARLAGDAQVHQRDFETATDAGAVDHRDRRMDARANRLHGRMDQFTVDAALRRIGRALAETR
jgi:hypothetical protein